MLAPGKGRGLAARGHGQGSDNDDDVVHDVIYDTDQDWKMTSENGSYLYPDLETGYNGVFR